MDIKIEEMKEWDNLQDHTFFWPDLDRCWYWRGFLLWSVRWWNNLLKHENPVKGNINLLIVGYCSSFSLLRKKMSVKRLTVPLGRPGMRNLTKDFNPPNPGVTGSYCKEISSFLIRDSRNRFISIGFQYGQKTQELSQVPQWENSISNAESSWLEQQIKKLQLKLWFHCAR